MLRKKGQGWFYTTPTSRSKSKTVAAMLTAEITILFIIENSGFNAPITIVPKAPNQTYETTNIPEVTNLRDEVMASILWKAA
jgi:hypothetical protein